MTLSLIRAVPDGIRRVMTRTGAIVLSLMIISQLLFFSTANTLLAAIAPVDISSQIGLTIPVSRAIAIGLFGVAVALTAATYVFIARAFARPLTELSSLPNDVYTHRIGRASLWMLLSGVIVFTLVMFGFAFFILPGIFLAACFLFVMFTIGVEDRGVISALRQSWVLSRGNRLRLIVIVLLFGLASVVSGIVPAGLDAANAAILSDVTSVILGSTVFVFMYGILAATYLQTSETTVDR